MEPDPGGFDSHQEQPESHKAPARDAAKSGRPAGEHSQASQPEADPAHPSGPEPKKFWLGPSIEMSAGGALMILALRGPGTADHVASVLGLNVTLVELHLKQLVASGLATATKIANPISVEPVIGYQASEQGLIWLQDRDIGRVVPPERGPT